MTDSETTKPDLSALIAKLEGATEGSRELDEAIVRRFGWTLQPDGFGVMDRWEDPDGKVGAGYPPAVTTSVDAALTLIERKLPGANAITLEMIPEHRQSPKSWEASLQRNYVKDGHWSVTASAPTAPLALCIALLRAIGAQP